MNIKDRVFNILNIK